MKRTILFFVAILIICSACKQKIGNDGQSLKDENTQRVILSHQSITEMGIESVNPAVESFNGFLTEPARILTNQDNEALVGSFIKGKVKKVFVNPGSYVTTGQELMELEGLEIGEIRSAYQKAKANLDFTETTYKRQKSLSEQNVSSQKTYLEAKAEYEKALADFQAEDEKIHSIGLTDEEALNNSTSHSAGRLIVKAPITGLVIERSVVIGQLVDDNSTAFRIINTSTVWAEAQIYEKDVPRLEGNSEAFFTSAIYPNEIFKGSLKFISQVVDEKTRTISIRAFFNNDKNRLKPQMFGELKIPVTKTNNAVTIPNETLVNDNGKYYVFIQVNDSTFEKRDIETGISNGTKTEIKKGLSVKDKVVTKGAFYIKSELMKSSFGGEE